MFGRRSSVTQLPLAPFSRAKSEASTREKDLALNITRGALDEALLLFYERVLIPALDDLRNNIRDDMSCLSLASRETNDGPRKVDIPEPQAKLLAAHVPEWIKEDSNWHALTTKARAEAVRDPAEREHGYTPATKGAPQEDSTALRRRFSDDSVTLDYAASRDGEHNGPGSDDEMVSSRPLMAEPSHAQHEHDFDREISPSDYPLPRTSLRDAPISVHLVWDALESSRNFINSQTFDGIISVAVSTNALLIGLETDYMARHIGQATPPVFVMFEYLYFIVFMMELGLRLFVYRCEFFLCSEWKWNMFDFAVVSLQAFENISKLCFATFVKSNFSFLRLVRMVRILRIIRLGRLLHLIVELRSMVSSIVGCFKSLCWALLLFIMLIYTFGVFFTQIVTERRAALGPLEHEQAPLLEFYFANLGRTVLSLWACISGGTDWALVLQPLMSEVSPMISLIFVGYTAFCILAMMNVVTGIFVEKSMSSAEADQAMCVVRNVIDVFEQAELNSQGEITWESFQEKLKTKEVQNLFAAVNIDESDAFGLFRLLDTSDSGSVSPEEFMNGWIRLRGFAKSVDLAMLMREVDRMTQYLQHKMAVIEKILNKLEAEKPAFPSESPRTIGGDPGRSFNLSECDFAALPRPVADDPTSSGKARRISLLHQRGMPEVVTSSRRERRSRYFG